MIINTIIISKTSLLLLTSAGAISTIVELKNNKLPYGLDLKQVDTRQKELRKKGRDRLRVSLPPSLKLC